MAAHPTLILNGTAARERAKRWIDSAPHNCAVSFKASKRSLPQNALMWARLTEVSHQVVWHGAKLSADDWKDVFTAALKRSRVVPGLDGGFVVLGQRTSDMTKDEMGQLLDLIDAFAAEHGVTFGGEVAA
jgi:hypothetical protein